MVDTSKLEWQLRAKTTITMPLYHPEVDECAPHLRLSEGFSVQNDNTKAALYMQKALEGSPDSLEYASDLERLLRRIPDQHCEALQVFSLRQEMHQSRG